MKGFAWALVGALFLLTLSGASQAAPHVRALAAPGGVAVIVLPDATELADVRAYYRERRVLLSRRDGIPHAWVGLPLDTEPGTHQLKLTRPDGTTETISFTVDDREYDTQHITIDDERMVTPDAEALKRIREESAEIRAALRTWQARDALPSRLAQPVDGRFSSPFGLQRFINEKPRNPHRGLDIAAATGTPIQAPAGGEVVAVGDYYFNGRTVIMEHGQGLVTLYAHMDSVDVAQGDVVEAGELLGTVGATGRATGPHLHWGVYLNGTAVDPELFLMGDD